MKRQLGPILIALVVMWAPAAWSQSDSTDSSSQSSSSSGSAQNGSTDTSQNGASDTSQNGSGDSSQQSTSGPQTTFTHPEQLPPLSLINEVTSHTGLVLSFDTGTVFYHDSYNTTHNSFNETLGLFGGGIHITQIRPTLLWSLQYHGGISLTSYSGTGISQQSALNQYATGNVTWQFAQRWQVAVKDTYLYTNDPFQPFQIQQIQPSYNNPNPLIYVPQAIVETNTGTVDVTYQIGAHDSLNFNGAESFQRFIRGTVSSFQNSYTYSAGSNYQHTFSAKFAGGGGYSFSALDFGHGQSRSGVQSFVGFASYQFSPNLTVTGWLGPQLTNTKNIVPIFCFPGFGCFFQAVYQSNWSIAEGGTLAWRGVHNFVTLKASHSISNGGGLLGAVRLYQGQLTYARPLSPRWEFLTSANYANSLSISHYRLNQYLKSLQGTVGLSRKLSESWNANVYYSFIYQDQNYLAIPTKLTTNGIGITLRYAWGHSLGR